MDSYFHMEEVSDTAAAAAAYDEIGKAEMPALKPYGAVCPPCPPPRVHCKTCRLMLYRLRFATANLKGLPPPHFILCLTHHRVGP